MARGSSLGSVSQLPIRAPTVGTNNVVVKVNEINDSYQHERLELTTDPNSCVTGWSFFVPSTQDKEEEAEYFVNEVVRSQMQNYGDDFDEELDDE